MAAIRRRARNRSVKIAISFGVRLPVRAKYPQLRTAGSRETVRCHVRPRPARSLLKPHTLYCRRWRHAGHLAGARRSDRFLPNFDRECAGSATAAWRSRNCGLSTIGCCETLEFLAATSNPLSGAETFANDAIVVADFASAIPFGNFRRALVCGAGHPARAPAVAAVALLGAALGGRSGWASSGSSSLRRKAVGRSGTDNTRSAAARGRSAEVGAWRASVWRRAIVR